MISFRIPKPTGNYSKKFDGEEFETTQRSPKGTTFTLMVQYSGRAIASFLERAPSDHHFVIRSGISARTTKDFRRLVVVIACNDFEMVQGADLERDLELKLNYTPEIFEFLLGERDETKK